MGAYFSSVIDIIILSLIVLLLSLCFFPSAFKYCFDRVESVFAHFKACPNDNELKDDQMPFSWLSLAISSVGLFFVVLCLLALSVVNVVDASLFLSMFVAFAILGAAWFAVISALCGCHDLINNEFAHFVLQKFSLEYNSDKSDKNKVITNAVICLFIGAVLISSLYFGGVITLALGVALLPLKFFPVAIAMSLAYPAHQYIYDRIKKNKVAHHLSHSDGASQPGM